MTQTLEAIFENGTFRLLEPPTVPLIDGQHVRLTVETGATPDDVLALAEQVYAGLSDEEIDDVERIALDRRAFFGDRTA
jgi:predicted DNA-binding antitoxin AbrB/MazE fold protein